jgi:hypothetical protein
MGFKLPPLKLPGLTKIKRIFPHVDQVDDAPTKQTITLLWERVHSLEERLQQTMATNTVLADRVETLTTGLTAAQATADAALAGVQPSGAAAGSGSQPPGPPAGDPGSQTNPIIAMSADLTAIAASVRASRQFYGFGPNPADDQYWIDHAKAAAQFSNGKWYLGWNRYWEVRADPANTGSADPSLGGEPAIHT